MPAAGLPGSSPYVRGRRAEGTVPTGWDVRAHHAAPDAAAVLTDLENGATSLWLALGPAGIPVDALPAVLADVYLDLAPVVLDAGPDTRAAADALLAARGGAGDRRHRAERQPRRRPARAAGPHRRGGAAGRRRRARPPLRRGPAGAARDHGGRDAVPRRRRLATPRSSARRSPPGVAYLRALTDAGLDVAAALGQLEFRYAATAGQFATIAKFRAARRLWARVAEVCGVTDAARSIRGLRPASGSTR